MTTYLWVLSGEMGLNGHGVERILDHAPSPEEIAALDDVVHGPNGSSGQPNPFKSHPTGWAGWQVTRLRRSLSDEWETDAEYEPVMPSGGLR